MSRIFPIFLSFCLLVGCTLSVKALWSWGASSMASAGELVLLDNNEMLSIRQELGNRTAITKLNDAGQELQSWHFSNVDFHHGVATELGVYFGANKDAGPVVVLDTISGTFETKPLPTPSHEFEAKVNSLAKMGDYIVLLGSVKSESSSMSAYWLMSVDWQPIASEYSDVASSFTLVETLDDHLVFKAIYESEVKETLGLEASVYSLQSNLDISQVDIVLGSSIIGADKQGVYVLAGSGSAVILNHWTPQLSNIWFVRHPLPTHVLANVDGDLVARTNTQLFRVQASGNILWSVDLAYEDIVNDKLKFTISKFETAAVAPNGNIIIGLKTQKASPKGIVSTDHGLKSLVTHSLTYEMKEYNTDGHLLKTYAHASHRRVMEANGCYDILCGTSEDYVVSGGPCYFLDVKFLTNGDLITSSLACHGILEDFGHSISNFGQ